MKRFNATKQWNSWGVADDDNGATHSAPMNDLREHDCSDACWCGPLYIGNGVTLHTSLDGRERVERGWRLPS